MQFPISCHYRTDGETAQMRKRIAGKLFKKYNLSGKLSMGEEHRIVIRYAYTHMFPDIDLSQADL